MAPPPNRRVKGIADSDDEDPDGERVQAPVVEEEEGSKEVPQAGGGEDVPQMTAAASVASVEVEGGAGVGSSTFVPPPPMIGRGRGRGTLGTPTPRVSTMPPVSEYPDMNTPEIR